MSERDRLLAACALLGVEADVTMPALKAAYHARAALLHPDAHQAAGDERVAAAHRALQQLTSDRELMYDTTAWTQTSRRQVASVVRALGCEYDFEGFDLVVDGADGATADAVIELLVDGPSV